MKLGAPLQTVELTDAHLDMCINDAIETYHKYVNFKQDFLALNLDNYVENTGFTLPNNVMSIFSIAGSRLSPLQNDNVFGTFNIMLNSGTFDFIFNPGGYSWISYEVAMQYTEVVNRMMGKGFDFSYDMYTKTLKLLPDPKTNSITGFIAVGAFVEPAEVSAYGTDYVKRLALAEAKLLLGTIRAKFSNVQLLGGGSVDASIKEEGKEERDKLIEEIQTKINHPLGFFVG